MSYLLRWTSPLEHGNGTMAGDFLLSIGESVRVES